MKRRDFIAVMLQAAIGAAILPAATTYARKRKPIESVDGLLVDCEIVTDPATGLAMMSRRLYYAHRTAQRNALEEKIMEVLMMHHAPQDYTIIVNP